MTNITGGPTNGGSSATNCNNRNRLAPVIKNHQKMEDAVKTLLTSLVVVAFVCSYQMIAQVPGYVPRQGLVGWWALDGNTNDASGKGNHGSSNGAVSTTDRNGKVNGAYYFDGIDDNITIPNSASLNPEYITICGWFKTSTIATDYLAGAKSLVSKW